MSDFSITREVDGPKGRYVLSHPNGSGELTYSIASDTLIIADHTDVSDGLRGMGAGAALAKAMVMDALAEGVKIVPLCPFVNAERRKHPAWAAAFST
ncbi:GNAT family N-acetyltransferase [Algirhabdus cladophorae]|uniref:GNAT family N-acetyltransferase n=1 Tax=Algirhabdus cladophorae TaxID=3377108 RepID=UPI003B84B1C0